MVLPKATLHFTRHAFSKSLTHGYAQSFVAATQSSYASQNNSFSAFGNRFTKFHNLHLNGFSTQNGGVRDNQDAGLLEYYKAWQKYERLGARDWKQFQFAKRIEWKPQTLAAESKASEQDVEDIVEDIVEASVEASPLPVVEEISISASRVEEVVESVCGQELGDEAALEQLDQALAEVSRQQKETETGSQEIAAVEDSVAFRTADVVERLDTSAVESDSYTQQLEKLSASKHYAEIPAVFEAMLRAGVTPTAPAYNALLAAAIHLPLARHDVVPKALDIYSDMLKRRVLPDVKTYSVLIDLLSARAFEVESMKNALEEKRARYGGMEEEGKFLFKSNEAEESFLAEDDSLNVAIRLFDVATSIHSQRLFSQRTYYLLVSACAEQGRIADMVRVYTHMESQKVIPRADMFVHMIQAFANSGNISNAVECYNEYKGLAIALESGDLTLSRKDNDVYAALIKAYTIRGDTEGAVRFLGKLEAHALNEEALSLLQDAVGLKALVPEWLKQGSFERAFAYVNEKLSGPARDVGFAAVCIRAADRNNVQVATDAFNKLSGKADVSETAFSMSAMYIRNGNMEAAEQFWAMLETSSMKPELIEAASLHAIGLIGRGLTELGLQRARSMFTRIREVYRDQPEIVEQIDEAIEVIARSMNKTGLVPPPSTAMQVIATMIENHGIIPSVAAPLLAHFGPEEIARLSWPDLELLTQTQAGMITNGSSFDIADRARFAHVLELLLGAHVSIRTTDAIEKALMKLDNADLQRRWQNRKLVAQEQIYSPVAAAFSPFPQTPVTTAQPTFEDSYDPYAATTDNKGSVVITDLLEKTHGRYANHLNEALIRFRNMRRSGRHPRFFTYAKLITAAAKENRMSLAHEVLALAKQDVPYQPQYRIVRYGWVTILDAMVAACLTTGQRHLADQFHQELLTMGAAPSANTFGLYITTLKESTKTFDEASEAVKIFLQAKTEGVEPSSFLYNALIGKLGKARRIDDCLFYFQEMRTLGIRPTSVTYGTIVNALCRVSDEKFAEELFEEMESMPNYKPRPAPYHSMMQFFLTTKRDRSKVLSYYERMRARNIQPTTHTFKLLIDTHATLEPVDMEAAERVLEQIRSAGATPDAVHYAALIHAKGCVAHDIDAARKLFDTVLAEGAVRPQPCIYQALFESMVANHQIELTEPIVADMRARRVEMTPYIANSLIHGWALANNVDKAEAIFVAVPVEKREPSTYEAMTRAYMVAERRDKAMGVVNEALARGYPSAVSNKILDLVGGGKVAALSPPLSASTESSAGAI